jgi:hypothetical protein
MDGWNSIMRRAGLTGNLSAAAVQGMQIRIFRRSARRARRCKFYMRVDMRAAGVVGADSVLQR